MEDKPIKFAVYDQNSHILCPKQPVRYVWEDKDGAYIIEDVKTGKLTRIVLP